MVKKRFFSERIITIYTNKHHTLFLKTNFVRRTYAKYTLFKMHEIAMLIEKMRHSIQPNPSPTPNPPFRQFSSPSIYSRQYEFIFPSIQADFVYCFIKDPLSVFNYMITLARKYLKSEVNSQNRYKGQLNVRYFGLKRYVIILTQV